MVIRLARFNTYLFGAALLLALSGCATTSSKADKQAAAIRLHLEANRSDQDRSTTVAISRTATFMVSVDKIPFLSEAQLQTASLVDSHGGFSIRLQFDQRGTWLLEQYTAMNPGKHIAIAAQFDEKLSESRWLAAPKINHRIGDGAFTFSPDATRAEAETILRGLNNAAIKNGNQSKPKKDKTKSP